MHYRGEGRGGGRGGVAQPFPRDPQDPGPSAWRTRRDNAPRTQDPSRTPPQKTPPGRSQDAPKTPGHQRPRIGAGKKRFLGRLGAVMGPLDNDFQSLKVRLPTKPLAVTVVHVQQGRDLIFVM